MTKLTTQFNGQTVDLLTCDVETLHAIIMRPAEERTFEHHSKIEQACFARIAAIK